MMRKLALEAERAAEEATLCAAAPAAEPILARLQAIYDELREVHALSEALERMRGIYHGSTLLAVGHALHQGSVEVHALELGMLPDDARLSLLAAACRRCCSPPPLNATTPSLTNLMRHPPPNHRRLPSPTPSERPATAAATLPSW